MDVKLEMANQNENCKCLMIMGNEIKKNIRRRISWKRGLEASRHDDMAIIEGWGCGSL